MSRVVRMALWSAITVLAAGCADRSVEPTQTSKKLSPRFSLSEGNEFEVDVNSDVILYDKRGKEIKRYTHKTRVKHKVRNGLASEVGSSGLSMAQLAAFDVDQAIPDSLNFMPVIAAANGELPTAVDQTDTDDQNNAIRTEATSTIPDGPFTNAKIYKNDTLQVSLRLTWTAVEGGYFMTEQRQMGFHADGEIAYIISTPDTSTMTISYRPSRSPGLFASIKRGIGRPLAL